MGNNIGVLVMAYGGPDSLEDIPGYLADIRHGRSTPRDVVEDILGNYRAIGGSSPLLEISRRQMEAIAGHFQEEEFQFYLGMRHWRPWIEDAVREMIEDDIQQAVSVVLAPHYSKLSVAKYQEKIQSGLDLYRGDIKFRHVDAYYDIPELIQAFASRVRQGLDHWTDAEREKVHVVFSAHSLPTRILDMGDPYDEQLKQTAKKIAKEAGLSPENWSWSYQSAGRSDEAWLGPQLEDHLPVLAEQGIMDVVAVPIGFVSDHVEILYDIDIQAQGIARDLGMKLVRPPALNTDPTFIAGVARVIREHTRF